MTTAAGEVDSTLDSTPGKNVATDVSQQPGKKALNLPTTPRQTAFTELPREYKKTQSRASAGKEQDDVFNTAASILGGGSTHKDAEDMVLEESNFDFDEPAETPETPRVSSGKSLRKLSRNVDNRKPAPVANRIPKKPAPLTAVQRAVIRNAPKTALQRYNKLAAKTAKEKAACIAQGVKVDANGEELVLTEEDLDLIKTSDVLDFTAAMKMQLTDKVHEDFTDNVTEYLLADPSWNKKIVLPPDDLRNLVKIFANMNQADAQKFGYMINELPMKIYQSMYKLWLETSTQYEGLHTFAEHYMLKHAPDSVKVHMNLSLLLHICN